MSVRIPIKGDTLTAAREMLHMSREELGRAANLAANRIAELESGDAQPTYRQMQKLAKKLDRSLAYFLAPAPAASDVPETADFRGAGGAEIPPALARELKRAAAHRNTFLEFADDVPLLKVPSGVTGQSVRERARDFRTMLGLTDDFRPTENQANAVFNFWRGQLEAAGYLVFQTTGISLQVFRGLSVHRERLPIIVLNGADAPNGKTFTLFHEVAHIANRTSGLCVLDDHVDEEAICNAFAAEFLMPTRTLRGLLNAATEVTPDSLAGYFRVSPLAAAVRLRTVNRMTQNQLDAFRRRADEEWEEIRRIRANGDGFVPPWRLRYRDLGPRYLGAVLRAVEQDRLTALDASYLLDARIPMVQQMQDEYFRTGGV